MKRQKLNWFKVFAFGCAIAMLASCDDSNEPNGKGDVEFEITDSPIDDANVKSVFVTIADLKVDGESVAGFTKQTIDLKAYQEGNTKLLVKGKQLDAKTYDHVTMVLDLDTDASGNSPGCYVLTTDDVKYNLKTDGTGTSDVTVDKNWSVAANATTTLVIDFDLRKSIAYSDNSDVRYSFVSDNDLESAVRVVKKDDAGTIHGTYHQVGDINADKIIVYAYKKGSFDADTETQVQGENEIRFANAVTSAEVKNELTGKTFTLALLEKGEYELHFAGYTEDPSDHEMMFDTLLMSETSVNGSAGDIITVQGGATAEVDGTIEINL